jgi:hypothetical protein
MQRQMALGFRGVDAGELGDLFEAVGQGVAVHAKLRGGIDLGTA